MQICWPIVPRGERLGAWWYVTGQKRKRGEPLGSVWPWETEDEDEDEEGHCINDEEGCNEHESKDEEEEGGEEDEDEEDEDKDEDEEQCHKKRRLNWPEEQDEDAAESEALELVSRLNPELEKCRIADS